MTLATLGHDLINLLYLLAAVCFIFGLKMLGKVETAARGNMISAVGMLLATVVTFFYITGGTWLSLLWIVPALALGCVAGTVMAKRVEMTQMPQMVALLNGFGGIASMLVALADYFNKFGKKLSYTDAEFGEGVISAVAVQPWSYGLSIGLAVAIGGVTFTGSIMAFGKLQGTSWAPDQPVQLPRQRDIVFGLLGALALMVLFIMIWPAAWPWIFLMTIVALGLGVLLVIGIGGADMPVVVALLNSYSGVAAAMAGFVLNNYALIITGSLVGSSGLILTNIMCKAMNRSLMNVLFGGMGAAPAGVPASAGMETQGTATESSPEDAAIVLEAASSVVVVPGYGMAVAQAQHAVKEFAAELESKGIEVTYAIHPVAGRMPGHMNVLLAEAGVEYDVLLDLEPANAKLESADVALVIGANDVTNPAARHDTASPLYGMPILNVDHARTVFVIKRSLNPGFAGIQNPLYFQDNTRMVFGDAKKVVTELVGELEQL
ncbi:NAD(P)(+) transhydrogenase (Re/Si-specific) subunit beta [Algisphaera agarilytica]|uniref:NAD(P) transhydrogenase subunit beta n=1 Tax=Algisphaera agarilytica TaxID=1385975 RepID=A0A7X0H3B9_9BACT|nr:NAD(P)(+) transhydrogenase (Re/Si-specific) subunit beta [Algisphaera agarilytica]MBB6428501.1 NAD(P) transhydrogenase subunit beta [Algisphaera agarilytica]